MIAFDNETGGIAEETSLLTTYFAVLDEQYKLIDELELYLKPNDGKPYVVEPGGLAVNKINLIQHDEDAITLSEGGQKLFKLLKHHGINDKLTPLGHNVPFDIGGINRHLLGQKTWNQFVSYKIQDTQVIASYLQRKGKFPVDMSMSLGSLANYFNVQVAGNPHESRYDTLVTIEVYKNLLRM